MNELQKLRHSNSILTLQAAKLKKLLRNSEVLAGKLLSENLDLDIRLKAACIDGGAIEKVALDKITKHVLDKIADDKRRGRPEPPPTPKSFIKDATPETIASYLGIEPVLLGVNGNHDPKQAIRNCVHPETGRAIWEIYQENDELSQPTEED